MLKELEKGELTNIQTVAAKFNVLFFFFFFFIHVFHGIQVATVEVLKVQKLCDTI